MAKAVDYTDDLQKRLSDKRYAVGYLNECATEDDSALMHLALCDVLQAHPKMAPFFVSAYARYLNPTDLQKLPQQFPELRDYMTHHNEVLGALRT